MKRLLGLLKKDFTIAYRNFFFLIVLVVACILIVVTNFLIPKQANLDSKLVFTIEGTETREIQPVAAFLEEQSGNEKVNSRAEVIDRMKKDKETIGVVIKVNGGKPAFEIILQGHESEQSRNALALSLESIFNAGQNQKGNIEYITLKTNTSHEKVPFNKSFVPLMILNEPVMLGFIFLATLIFMEKEEDTIKAYMVSPGGIGVYLLSKIILMVVLGLISTVLITLATLGFKVNWLMLLITAAVGGAFGSTLAMLLASFFENISKAMIWILGISLILTAPMISYFVPSFSPTFITIMPTYNLMFAIREAVFPSGNPAVFYQTTVTLSLMSVLLYGASVVSYRQSILKD